MRDILKMDEDRKSAKRMASEPDVEADDEDARRERELKRKQAVHPAIMPGGDPAGAA